MADSSAPSQSSSSQPPHDSQHGLQGPGEALRSPRPYTATLSASRDPEASGGAPGEDAGGEATAARKKLKRTKDGCVTCRRRKKLCDLTKPSCNACIRLALTCEWEDKQQAAIERRKKRAERKEQREREEKEKDEREKRERELVEQAQSQAQLAGTWLGASGSWAGVPLGESTGVPEYDPATPSLFPSSLSPAFPSISLPPAFSAAPALPHSTPHPDTPWMPFLGSFAPAPTAAGPAQAAPATDGNSEAGPSWATGLSNLVTPHQPAGSSLQLAFDASGSDAAFADQLMSLQNSSQWNNSPPFDISALLRTPTPPQPFSPIIIPGFDNFSMPIPLSLPGPAPSLVAPAPAPAPAESVSAPIRDVAIASRPSPRSQLTRTVSHAASFLASSDFAFTQSYLLSHYTTSLARVVSIATDSSPSSSSRSSSSRRSSETNSATAAGANLFLSLIPIAHRYPHVMYAILSWSAANLAASNQRTAAPSVPLFGPTAQNGGETSVMGTLSDELTALAERDLEELLPRLQEERRRREQGDSAGSGDAARDCEAVLAARLMLCQATICRGTVDAWRTQLRKAAEIVELGGGMRAFRTPLARALIRNAAYHDVLSSSASKEGLLFDYAAMKGGRAEKGTPGSTGTTPMSGDGRDEADAEEDSAEEDDEVLDTLMGIGAPVFLLIGRITALAKDKRQAIQRSGTNGLAEDDLAALLVKAEEVRTELEAEKERVEALMQEREDLQPHRYFHEVFRLAALAYLLMLQELPPRALPMLLLVRKMLSVGELIVASNLPGLCSMHWPLFIMQLNATPLVSPHAGATDQDRANRLFEAHISEFAFLNTKRSKELVAEVWRRSNHGKAFIDPDAILAEWQWDLNFA
ncbi:hypothetical protein JCM10207_000416 [Rhodosporidiobolus poonsookiae]